MRKTHQIINATVTKRTTAHGTVHKTVTPTIEKVVLPEVKNKSGEIIRKEMIYQKPVSKQINHRKPFITPGDNRKYFG